MPWQTPLCTRLSLYLSLSLSASLSLKGVWDTGVAQMFVPTKAAKPVRLAPDQRAYDAQQLDKVGLL